MLPANHVVDVVLQKQLCESYCSSITTTTMPGRGGVEARRRFGGIGGRISETWDEDKRFRDGYKPFARVRWSSACYRLWNDSSEEAEERSVRTLNAKIHRRLLSPYDHSQNAWYDTVSTYTVTQDRRTTCISSICRNFDVAPCKLWTGASLVHRHEIFVTVACFVSQSVVVRHVVSETVHDDVDTTRNRQSQVVRSSGYQSQSDRLCPWWGCSASSDTRWCFSTVCSGAWYRFIRHGSHRRGRVRVIVDHVRPNFWTSWRFTDDFDLEVVVWSRNTISFRLFTRRPPRVFPSVTIRSLL